MGHPDEDEWRQDAAMMEWFDDQLKAQAREPVFAFLARYGDAVQARVDTCRTESAALRAAGFPGAALVRTAAGIELAVRFFLVQPLVLSAFLSDEWARLLTDRMFKSRTADDRKLLPAILRNWGVPLTSIKLSDGSQMWEALVQRVWKARNEYVHAGATVLDDEAAIATECLECLLANVVSPIARELGFTREDSGRWSVVFSRFDRSLNPPTECKTASPFDSSAA